MEKACSSFDIYYTKFRRSVLQLCIVIYFGEANEDSGTQKTKNSKRNL